MRKQITAGYYLLQQTTELIQKMQTTKKLTIYVRKVDKRAIKLEIPQNSYVTSRGLYDLLLSQNEFVKFVQDDIKHQQSNLSLSNGSRQLNREQLRRSIELYYLGNLIDKNDEKNQLKLKDMSIIHLIVKKICRQKDQRKSNEQNISVQSVRRQTNGEDKGQQLSKTQQNKINSNNYKQDYKIGLRILLNKNILIETYQNVKLSIPNLFQPIVQLINFMISESQLREECITESLSRFKLLNKIEQKISSMNLGKDQNLNVKQVSWCKLKLVHLGRVVEVSLCKDSEVKRQVQSKQSQWSYLNLFNNSEVIVLVSAITVKTQKVVNDIAPHNNTKSLFLQLQHILTLRLYEEYKKWEHGQKETFNQHIDSDISQKSLTDQKHEQINKNQRDTVKDNQFSDEVNNKEEQHQKDEPSYARSLNRQNEFIHNKLKSDYKQKEKERALNQTKKYPILIF